MNITSQVAQILDQVPVNEKEYSGGGDLYQAFNDAGVECEVGELLYSMIRVLKPYNVLETGTHRGISTLYMALAMQHNGFGVIDTLEFISDHFEYSDKLFKSQEQLADHINNMQGDVTKWTPKAGTNYGMALLDTEPQLRFAEFVRFFDYFADGSFIFIHDLHRHMGQMPNDEHGFAWPWGNIPGAMKGLVREGKIRPFHFPAPRGLTGFYKISKDDYQWR